MDNDNAGKGVYELVADTSPFSAAMKTAEDSAKRSGGVIADTYALAETRIVDSSRNMAQAIALEGDTYQLAANHIVTASAQVNTAFDRQVQHAVEATQALRAMREVLNDVPTGMSAAGSASSGASRGILQLSYAIDDLQYGFGAIVNNIPQIALGMGLGAGLTGVLGIAAVAASVLTKHWGELVDVFTSSEAKLPTLQSGVEGLTDSLRSLSNEIEKLKEEQAADENGLWGSGYANFGIKEQDRLRKLERLKEQGEHELANEKAIEQAATDEETKKNAQAFKSSVGKVSGGSEAVIKWLTMNTDMTSKEAREAMGQALQGSAGDIEDIAEKTKGAKGFNSLQDATPQAQWEKVEDKLFEQIEKDAEAARKKAEAKRKADNAFAEKLNDQGEANEDFGKRRDFEQDKKERLSIQEGRRNALQDEMKQIMKRPDAEIYGSAQQYLSSVQQTALNDPKLKKMEELREKLDDINDSIQNIRGNTYAANKGLE